LAGVFPYLRNLSIPGLASKLSSLFFSGIGNRYVGTENYRAFSFPMKEEGSSIGTELKAFLTGTYPTRSELEDHTFLPNLVPTI